jgi:predicted acyl esterase
MVMLPGLASSTPCDIELNEEEIEGNVDMNLFVAIEKIDRTRDLVRFPFFTNHNDGPVASGWLRVSRRELDEKKSTPYQPFYKHQRQILVMPGEIVPVDIEILPSSTLFGRGEKLRVVVQGNDIYYYLTESLITGHRSTVNKGEHVIYTGRKYDSYLPVPVIPAK